MSKTKIADINDIIEIPGNKLFDNGLCVDAGLPPLTDSAEGTVVVSSLLKKKGDLNEELTKNRTYYDKTYQTAPGRDGGNPFASKRNEEDQLQTQADPQTPDHKPLRSSEDKAWMGSMGIKQSEYHKDPDELPPREDLRNYSAEGIKKEVLEEDRDLEKTSSLLIGSFNHTVDTKRAAVKVASVKSLRAFVTPTNIKIHDQHLVVNLPRTASRDIEFDSKKLSAIENEISRALNVRAKYAHFMVSSSYDGVALEFLLC
jgi:hypothetical protein